MPSILIDVRSKEEFENGHKDGAVNIPISNIMEGNLGVLESMSKDSLIECYCASGARSGKVKQILNSRGYINVINLGGF